MVKKYYIILLVFCFFMLFCITDVLATEVTDRDIAIACILASGNHSDGITVSQDLGARPDRIRNYGDRHELDDWFIVDFSNNWIANLGMTALVLEKDNNVIISFRGTDTEWLEDAVNGVLNFHIQEFPANAYVKKIVKQYSEKEGNYKFYVTGYSLGGYIAQTAGATIEKEASKYSNIQLAKIIDFNGIGINFLTLLGNLGWGGHTDEIEILKRLGEEGRLVDYYIYGDIISAAGMHYGEMRSILPSIDTISEIGSKYTIFNSAEKLLPISSLIAILMENAVNAFKTEIYDAARTYDVFSIMAFLELTHGGTITEFGSLNYIEASEKPKVIISANKNIVPEEGLNISSNITLKAETHNASVKSYKWYVSNDGQTWGEPIKEINLYDRNSFESPTNKLEVNINDFEKGETKYYKVVSNFNDKCTSSQYKYNIKKLQYEYIKNEVKSSLYNQGTTETIIKLTNQTEVNTVNNWFSSLFNKNWFSSLLTGNNSISNILGLFTQLTDVINVGGTGFTNALLYFTEDSSSFSFVVGEQIYESLINIGNFTPEKVMNFEYVTGNMIESIENTNKFDIFENINTDNNSYIDGEFTYAVLPRIIENTLKTIVDKEITLCGAEKYKYNDAHDSYKISNYHIGMLLEKIETPTLEDCMSGENSINYISSINGDLNNLKNCIDNGKPCSVRVLYKSDSKTSEHWITCVGYKNNGETFKDFLFISSYFENNGKLISGGTNEAYEFYNHNGGTTAKGIRIFK